MKTFYDGFILGYWRAHKMVMKSYIGIGPIDVDKEKDARAQVRHDFIEVAQKASTDPYMTKNLYLDICAKLLCLYQEMFGPKEDTFYTVLKREMVNLGLKLGY